MKIKGAIFDMDGTLIDSLGIWDIFWDGIGKKFMNDDNFVPDAELDRTCRTTVFSKDIELIREFYSIETPLEELMKFGEDLIYDYYRTKTKVKDDYKSTFFSVPVGVSYEFNSFVFDARYNIGISKVAKDYDGSFNALTFTVGYKF